MIRILILKNAYIPYTIKLLYVKVHVHDVHNFVTEY